MPKEGRAGVARTLGCIGTVIGTKPLAAGNFSSSANDLTRTPSFGYQINPIASPSVHHLSTLSVAGAALLISPRSLSVALSFV